MGRPETRIMQGRVFNGEQSARASLIIEQNELSTEAPYCIVIVQEPIEYYHFVQKDEDGNPFIQVAAQEHGKDRIWIPFLYIHGDQKPLEIYVGDRFVWHGHATLYVDAYHFFDSNAEGEFTCTLTVPSSPLFTLLSDYHFPDENETRPYYRQTESTGIGWQTPWGPAELVRVYSYRAQTIIENRAFVEQQRCAIQLKMHVEKGVAWKTVVMRLHTELSDACWLLSFLSKKRIDWFEGLVSWTEANGESGILQLRRDTHMGINPRKHTVSHEIDLLVKRTALSNGIFSNMVATLEASPLKDTVIRAIQQIMLTYEDFYLETYLGLLYVTFEMLVNSLSQDNSEIVDESIFRKTEQELKKVLRSSNLDPKVIDEVENKLRELRRRSLKRKALHVLEKYKVNLNEVYPKGKNAKHEFQRLIEGRNEYTHQGAVNDIDRALQDIHRLRYLVSILVLRLLNYPADQINEHEEDLTLSQREKQPFE